MAESTAKTLTTMLGSAENRTHIVLGFYFRRMQRPTLKDTKNTLTK